MRKSSLWVLSLLLAMSLGGCSGGGGGEPEVNNPNGEGPNGEGPNGEGPNGENPNGEGPIELDNYPAIKAFLEKVERARAGEAVDFDGDGHKEFSMWFDESGVRYVEANGPPHTNAYRYASERHPDGAYKTTYSAYADGVIDTQEEQRGDGKRVTLYDTDRDGTFDKRKTLMVTDNPAFFRAIDEERTPEGGWREVRNELVSKIVPSWPNNAKANNAHILNVPALSAPRVAHALQATTLQATTATSGTMDLTFGINFITSGDGHCTPEESRNVLEAMDGILEQSLPCLEATNPSMANALKDALSGKHHVNFYCGFEGTDLPAHWNGFAHPGEARTTDGGQTWVWTSNAETPGVIRISRGLAANPPTNFQEFVFHEFLHTLGFDVGNNEAHEQGEDETNSCSRYCSGCGNGGWNPPEHATTDCERCADSRYRKTLCRGWEYIIYSEFFEDYLCGIEGELGGDFKLVPCSQMRCISILNCDGIHATDFLGLPPLYGKCDGSCCDTCPVDNLMKCDEMYEAYGKPPGTYDHCLEEPPFCPGGHRWEDPNIPWPPAIPEFFY